MEERNAVPRPVTEEVCTPAEEPECHNVVDVIQEQHCEQVAEEHCTQVSRIVEMKIEILKSDI